MSRLKYPKQVSNKYYIQRLGFDYLELKEKDVIPYTFKTYPFFIHRPYETTSRNKRGYKFSKTGWQITDALTGLRVYWLDEDCTPEQLISAFKEWFSNFEKRNKATITDAILRSVERNNTSPRYEKWNAERKYYDKWGISLDRTQKRIKDVPEYDKDGFYHTFSIKLEHVWKNNFGLDIEVFIMSTIPEVKKDWWNIEKELERKYGKMGIHWLRKFVGW